MTPLDTLQSAASQSSWAIARAYEGSDYQQRYANSVMPTYPAPQRVLVRGQGCHVWDDGGNQYLDLLAGVAVNALGHAHPAVVEAVNRQLTTLGHISNLYTSPQQIALAEKLLEISDAPAGSRVFFCNSGAEAVEVAFKITRCTGKKRIVATYNAFHGRTAAALAMTYKAAYREPFEPLPPEVVHVPFGDATAVEQALTADTAAVIVEPIQGEGGVNVPPRGYLSQLRAITRKAGVLLILDEVQTGMGRTGTWFAHHNPVLAKYQTAVDAATVAEDESAATAEASGFATNIEMPDARRNVSGSVVEGFRENDNAEFETVAASGFSAAHVAARRESVLGAREFAYPDVMTLAKGLAAGIPIGATIAFGDQGEVLQPGMHGCTFGGNPVSTAAALETIDTIEREGLRENAWDVGEYLRAGLRAIDHPLLAGARGVGLLSAVELTQEVAVPLQSALLEAGFITNAVCPDALRITPPLIITKAEIDTFLMALPQALATITPRRRG